MATTKKAAKKMPAKKMVKASAKKKMVKAKGNMMQGMGGM